jgi:hypothetical protein
VDFSHSTKRPLSPSFDFNTAGSRTVVDEADKTSFFEPPLRLHLGNRAKESLVVDFINQTNLDEINDKANVIDAFFSFAQAEQKRDAEAIIAS